MDLQQHCNTADRRRRVRDTRQLVDGLELNGIDYLEVLDDDAPSEALRQRLIELVFLKPDGVLAADGTPLLSERHIVIEGGERIRDVHVTSVSAGADDRSLTLTLNKAGDFSTYRLRLADGLGGAAVGNMDPILSCLDFSFKADCPTPFDCVQPAAASLPRTPGPVLDYLAKDYGSFRQVMLDRLSVTLPEWTERSPADLGVTLVEALAYAADMASYYQDAVATEAYLPLARHRRSVRRHSRLLGYRPSEGVNARTWVAINVDRDVPGDADRPALPAGTVLLSKPQEHSVAVGLSPGLPRDEKLPEKYRALRQAGSEVFETMEPLATLKAARGRMNLYTWGDRDCCLPEGTTKAHVIGTAENLGLAKGDVVILEETGTGDHPADAALRQAVRLSQVPREMEDPITGTAVLEINWDEQDALSYPLALNRADGRAAIARGNVVLADHGRSMDYIYASTAPPDEVAVSLHADLVGEGRTGLRIQPAGGDMALQATLSDGPVVMAEPFDAAAARLDPDTGRPQPAALTLVQSPADALPQVRLADGAEHWRPVHDLLGSDAFAQDFVLEHNGEDVATLRFGDGRFGRQPGRDANFRARVRIGGGPEGNVGANAIGYVITDDPEPIVEVTNPLPASGHAPAERSTSVKINAPRAFYRQRRAVTLNDYETHARAHSKIARAAAERRWTGSWHTVFLAIDAAGEREFNRTLEADLRGHIEPVRLAGHDVELEAPDYVPIDLALVVCVAPDHYSGDVEQALLGAFSSGARPGGSRGFFHPDNFTFGTPVRLSRIIAEAMTVAGVNWVGLALPGVAEKGHLRRLWDRSINYGAEGVLPIGRREVARLDNDPNTPELGRLRFIMEGGR